MLGVVLNRLAHKQDDAPWRYDRAAEDARQVESDTGEAGQFRQLRKADSRLYEPGFDPLHPDDKALPSRPR